MANPLSCTAVAKQDPCRLFTNFRIAKNWSNKVNLSLARKDLTVAKDKSDNKEKPDCVFYEDADFFYAPRYYGLKEWSSFPQYRKALSNGVEIPLERSAFVATLDEKQRRQHTATRECLVAFHKKQSQGCVLRMPCGCGKTVCALYLVAQKRRRTIYIVQSEDLFPQTIKAIHQFMPNVKVGQIQGPVDTWILEDCDIVVAMMQTLYYHRQHLKSQLVLTFGMVIVDECHHVGAPTFCAVLQRFAPMYMLGLSATPTRKDGKSDWIEWMMGPIVDVFTQEDRQRRDITVHWAPRLPTSIGKNHFVWGLRPYDHKENQILLNLMMWDIARRNAQVEFIFHHVLKTCEWRDPNEPQIVIFSNRIFHLCLLSYSLQCRYVIHTIFLAFPELNLDVRQAMAQYCFYHAEMNDMVHSTQPLLISSVAHYHRVRNSLHEQINEAQKSYLKYVNRQLANVSTDSILFPMRILRGMEKAVAYRSVLFATTKKLGEGVDVKTLDTVCLMTSLPTSNLGQLEQVVGRLRPKSYTQHIYEFIDCHPEWAKQSKSRQVKFYNTRQMTQIFATESNVTKSMVVSNTMDDNW